MATHSRRVRPGGFYHRIASSKTFEQWEPYLFGGVTSVVSYYACLGFPSEKAILASSVTAGSIIVGFLSTAMILLLSLDSSRMTQVRNSGYIVDLVSYLREAIYIALTFIGLSMAGYFIAAPGSLYMAVWLAVLVASFFSFRRIVRICLVLLQQS